MFQPYLFYNPSRFSSTDTLFQLLNFFEIANLSRQWLAFTACYAATIIHKKLLIVVSPSTSKNWAADATGAANHGPIIGIQNTLL
jgi:hypothetical protein